MVRALLNRLFGRGPRSVSDLPCLGRPIENAELACAEYEAGKTVLTSLPQAVNFSLSTYCNFKMPCLPCDRHTRPEEADSETDETVIEAVTPLLRTALRVILHAGGEAMFSRCFDRVIGSIVPPTRAAFATNGYLLTKRKTELMLEQDIMGLLSISLDAATPGTYRIMRPSSDFETVTRNITYYAERAAALGREQSVVSLSMTVCKTNLEDVPEFIDLAAKLGAPHVEYRHLNEGFSHVVKTVDGWDWVYEEQQRFDDPERHDALMFEAYRRAEARGIKMWVLGKPFIGPFAHRVEPGVIEDLQKHNPYVFPEDRRWFCSKRKPPQPGMTLCPGPWRKLAVQPKGEVRLCCFHDITRLGLGNVMQSDILRIWNSPGMIAQRKQALRNSFSHACLSSLPCGYRDRP